MRDIKSLSFAMTDSDYFMISGMQNHYSALVAHRLSPCLDRNKCIKNQYNQYLDEESLCHLLKKQLGIDLFPSTGWRFV